MRRWKQSALGLLLLLVTVAGMGTYLLLPKHQAQYCWLEFGPEKRLRILVRMDSYGNQIALTHYVDGQATGRIDQFPHFSECQNLSVADPDGQASYLLTKSGRTCTHRRGDPTEMFFSWDIKGSLNYKQYCDVMLMPCEPEAAQSAHFHGPLRVELRRMPDPADMDLKRLGKPTTLSAIVGTFNPDEGCWVIVRHEDETTKERLFPKTVHPLVEVEFPSAAGQAPVKRRYPLANAVGKVLFQGAIRVPEEATNGPAKLRFSFERWKGADVEPSTAELPVVDGTPE